jgi:UDP:flavonoid glycosyltransferase YjiC (YdhE family)
MAQRTVLLVSHDAGGTVPPMLALAEEFRSRGWRVVWLGQPSIEMRAAAVGGTYVPLDGVADYASRVTLESQLAATGPVITGAEIGESLLRAHHTHDADLFVIDANLAGAAAAAETVDVPSAILLHSLYATFTDVWFADLWPMAGPAINTTRGRFGLSAVDGWPGVFAPHHRLLSIVPHRFDQPTHHRAPNLRHVGFLVPRLSVAGPAAWPSDRDRPNVLVGLSTTYQHQERLLQAILDGLGALDVNGIVSTAGQVEHTELRVPANVALHDVVDHNRLVPATDVMITHAGLGTVAAALSHGVPLVCCPLGRDQHLNAFRVEQLGAGLHLDRCEDPTRIAEAVQAILLDGSYRHAALDLARRSREAGGAPAAVDVLLNA